VCSEALASDALRFTRASCQSAFDVSNTTLTLLGLERQLPRCAFCNLADALEASRHNPLEFLHLANPRTVCLVLHRHGPFGQLAQLGAIVHEGMRDVRRCWPLASWRGTRRAPSRSSAALTSSWCTSRRCRCPRTWRTRWSTCSSPRCHLQPRSRG
jgi:hypothetical protein